MSLINDLDPDALISRLAGPLSPRDREAFRVAAEAALSRVSCRGEGVFFRTLAALQSRFRVPPGDRVASWDIEQELGASRLRDAPPIEPGSDLRRVRHYRKQT